jgi:hypothetical protein
MRCIVSRTRLMNTLHTVLLVEVNHHTVVMQQQERSTYLVLLLLVQTSIPYMHSHTSGKVWRGMDSSIQQEQDGAGSSRALLSRHWILKSRLNVVVLLGRKRQRTEKEVQRGMKSSIQQEQDGGGRRHRIQKSKRTFGKRKTAHRVRSIHFPQNDTPSSIFSFYLEFKFFTPIVCTVGDTSELVSPLGETYLQSNICSQQMCRLSGR